MTHREVSSQAGLSREEVAKIEVGHTTVEPLTATCLVFVFLGLLVAAALFEASGGSADPTASGAATPWSHLTRLAVEVPQQLAVARASAADPSAWTQLVTANRAVLAGLEAFENAIEDEARIGRLLRPPTQLALTGWLGVGNERVYRGRGGWLFYRPDVEYVMGPGFLSPGEIARRVASAAEWTDPPEPDPRPAIVRFHQQLEARGILLVVVPTPVKPTVHPDRLARAYDGHQAPLQSPSYAAFLQELRRLGVTVFDPAPPLVDDARRDGTAQYLATDTHWRPEAVERTADRLGRLVQASVPLPSVDDPGYLVQRREVSSVGDTTAMLDLPDGQRRYPRESVVVRRVVGPDGSPWRPSRAADVLVLGDSFSNIYSTASLGWGDSAGLIEQLSYVLRRPVDRIVQNDQGAFATRARLRREIEGGSDRLAGKRVVIYQFAVRELSSGDWKIVDLPPAGHPR